MDLFDKASAALENIEIYDLDTYFQNLENLVQIDRSFMRLPLDEPFFEIVDGGKDGRRKINVPADFQKNGLSVQGDESAEIVYFSIDRYYDNFDLMGPSQSEVNNTIDGKYPVRIVIQWETKTAKGVSLALTDSDGRPFLDKNGKLYFGWAISSEITKEAGPVSFNVRFYQFSGEKDPQSNRPILAFGLNTQTASVKINQALAYEITDTQNYKSEKDLAKFEGAELILGKNELVLNRLINSSKFNDSSEEVSPIPNIIKDIDLTNEFGTEIVELKKYNEETGEEVPTGETETYHKVDLENGKLDLQVLAIPSEGTGTITYAGRQKATPDAVSYKINSDSTDDNYETVFVAVEDFGDEELKANRKEGFRFYIKDESTGQYIIASDLPAAGEAWRDQDKKDGKLIYYIKKSPSYEVTKPGYYYIAVRNKEGKKQDSIIASNRILVEHAEALKPEDVIGGSENIDEPSPVFLLNNKVDLSVTLNAKERNTMVSSWKKDDVLIENAITPVYQSEEIPEEDRKMFNSIYTYSCYTERNGEDTKASAQNRYFRVTDTPHAFVFNVEPGESEVSLDKRRVVQLDNFDLDLKLNMDAVSDEIKYRWRKRVGQDADKENIFVNDAYVNADGAVSADETEFIQVKIENNQPPQDLITHIDGSQEGAYFYCEVINIVNGQESELARTEYFKMPE